MKELGVGKVATVMGPPLRHGSRFCVGTRRKGATTRWSAARAFSANDAVQAIKASYETIDETGKHLTDEFVLPTVIDPEGTVKANDSVVFFNFRPDRAREITRAFVDPDFTGFDAASTASSR